jgi:hypothetical protein
MAGLILCGPAAAADFSKYHSYNELTAALKALSVAQPNLARLASIGKTREGRDIWALEIANPAGTPVRERPGLLIVANLEGDQLIGSALALYVADHMLSSYGSDAVVKQRLDSHVIYIVPRLNPDGAEQMFAPVKAWRRTNATPVDADNDGRTAEDGCEDLNKDGFITIMRVKDPKGAYMISPEDRRLMRKADPQRGEAGGYSIYWEGVDSDNDGFLNEDGAGGVDVNRNFQHQYPYYTPDAGPHMLSEAESRALIDFVLQRKNIAAILAFGESDNLIVAPNQRGDLGPPAAISLLEFADASIAGARKTGMFDSGPGMQFGRGQFGGGMGQRPGADAPQTGQQRRPPPQRPATSINAADLEYFRMTSEKYRELTGIRAVPVTRSPAGAFFEYGYYQFGVPSFSTPGWGLPARTEGGGPRGDAARQGAPQDAPRTFVGQQPGTATAAAATPIDLRLLQWMDAEKIDGFVEWQPFNHPTLGAVEIGGFKPYAANNPPASMIAELGAGHAKFVTYLTSLFPSVKIASAEVVATVQASTESGPRSRTPASFPRRWRTASCRVRWRRRWCSWVSRRRTSWPATRRPASSRRWPVRAAASRTNGSSRADPEVR